MKIQKTNPKLPGAEEWDFHKVDPILLSDATEYEYFRTSEVIRPLIVRWLDSPLKGKPVREHIRDAIIKRQTETPHEKFPDNLDPYFPEDVMIQILEIGEKITPPCCYLYESILQHRPDFPRPWTSLNVKGEWNKNFKRVRLYPMEQELKSILERAERWPKGWKDYLEMKSRISSDCYRLDIDFFADGRLSTIDEIMADFEQWLRTEVRRTDKKMRVGRRAQVEQDAYPLKCLAALRLRRAGFTQKAAADELKNFESLNWIVPYFKNAASWTKAIQFAERKLTEIESAFVPVTPN